MGTEGSDTIVGTPGDDVIVALGGRDVITGGGGNDVICAGPGDDDITTGDGDDWIDGGDGNDDIDAGDGDNVVYGGPGQDVITTGAGNDWIDAGDGQDKMNAGAGDDVVYGGAGNDDIDAGDGNDFIFGGAGNDRVDGEGGDDVIVGGPGNDSLDGGTDFNVVCDEDGNDNNTNVQATGYADADRDGYGDPNSTSEACVEGGSWAPNPDDCDDTSAAVNPAADEVCNGIDDNCDAVVDTDAVDRTTWYIDADGDAYGEPFTGVTQCAAPPGTAPDGTDCDDSDPLRNPGLGELCNGWDDDCDLVIDEPQASDAIDWHPDADVDGFGAPTPVVRGCNAPPGYVASWTDCDDADPAVHPGVAEACDGVDQDCDGVADDGALGPYPNWLLEPVAGTFTENGVGSPSVAYMTGGPLAGTYVMAFETRVTAPTATCPGGEWGIGFATSTNAMQWSVLAQPRLLPQAGSFYSCVAAHPRIVADGSTLHLWFKAEQRTDACASGTPSWGCDRQTGVGYASYASGALSVGSTPALQVSGFGFPAVVRVDGGWHMWLAKVPSLYHAYSESPGSGWVLDAQPVVQPGYTPWVQDRVFNPAALCHETDPKHPFSLWLGGKDLDDANVILSGGWGETISADGVDWFVADSPERSWAGELAWRHWDVLKVGAERKAVFFSEKDGSGKNRIGLSFPSCGWDAADVDPKVCDPGAVALRDPPPTALWSDGFDAPAGREQELDLDPSYVPDTGARDTGAGSGTVRGCAHGSGGGGFLVLLLSSLAVRSRRVRA